MIFYLVIILILIQTMITIRRNVFETNSSSTHVITIIPDDGNKYYIYEGNAITEEERKKIILDLAKGSFGETSEEYKLFQTDFETAFNMYRNKWDYYDYPLSKQEYIEFFDNDFEFNIENYTTKSGDKITIISKYGFDY